jgi:curved DNA-binding protein CbpA
MKWNELNRPYESLLEELRKMAPHDLLGVPPGASASEIRSAYRRKISRSHPDRSSFFMRSTDQEISKLINSAYDALMKGVPRE